MGEKISKIKKLILYILLIIVIVLLFVLCEEYSGNSKTNKIGEHVIQLLDEKYSRDFAIKEGKYIRQANTYEFRVYPKDDPKFVFPVWIGNITDNGVSDSYVSYNHGRTLEKWVTPFMDDISDNLAINAANVPIKGRNDTPALIYRGRNSATLEQMLEHYPQNMEVYIEAYIGLNITKENRPVVLKEIYNLIKFLKNKKFSSIHFWLKFYSPKIKIREEAEKWKDHGGFRSQYLNKDKYFFSMDVDNMYGRSSIKDIKNVKDIEKYLKINEGYNGGKMSNVKISDRDSNVYHELSYINFKTEEKNKKLVDVFFDVNKSTGKWTVKEEVKKDKRFKKLSVSLEKYTDHYKNTFETTEIVQTDNDPDTGFQSVTFGKTDDKGKISTLQLEFRGTEFGLNKEGIKDTFNDLSIISHNYPLQQDAAEKAYKNVVDYAKNNGISDIYIGGHSMGAPMATLIGIKYYEDIKGVNLLAPLAVSKDTINLYDIIRNNFNKQTPEFWNKSIKAIAFPTDLVPKLKWQISDLNNPLNANGKYIPSGFLKNNSFIHGMDLTKILAYDENGNYINGKINKPYARQMLKDYISNSGFPYDPKDPKKHNYRNFFNIPKDLNVDNILDICNDIRSQIDNLNRFLPYIPSDIFDEIIARRVIQ